MQIILKTGAVVSVPTGRSVDFQAELLYVLGGHGGRVAAFWKDDVTGWSIPDAVVAPESKSEGSQFVCLPDGERIRSDQIRRIRMLATGRETTDVVLTLPGEERLHIRCPSVLAAVELAADIARQCGAAQ